jgi:uncharacterized protein involved in type VI secretion and phage assembly
MAIPDDMDWRFLVPWPAEVVEIADPLGLHRVKFSIPGLVAESPWAFPTTAGGGSAQTGGHIVPAVGSTVFAQWLGGDPERPIYSGGSWGVTDAGSEMPQSIRDAGDQAHLVHAVQLGPIEIVVDLRPRDVGAGTGQLLSIEDRNADTTILTYDITKQGMSIEADYLIQIIAAGIVKIEAAQLQTNQRTMKPSSRAV